MGILSKKADKAGTAPPKANRKAMEMATTPRVFTIADIDELKNMLLDQSDARACKTAAKALYELSDVSHKKNRTLLVRTCPSVVNALCSCLLATTGDARHLSLLSLNNLSIPSENKKAFNTEEMRNTLVGALVQVVESDPNESYLACIALMNLSFLEACVADIACYPGLLPVIEELLKEGVRSKAGSGKSEGVRWAAGLLKNLSKNQHAASLIAQTSIVPSLLQTIKSPSGSSRWSNNSVEDFTLFVMLHLAQHQSHVGDLFDRAKVVIALAPIAKSVVGVHSLKATLALGILECAPKSKIPAAAGSEVTGLVDNILSKRGKDKEYSAGVFKLSTATAALRGIATRGDASTVATPACAALLFQIVASYVLASRETSIDDLSPALDAAAVFGAVLPILSRSKSDAGAATIKSVAELSSLFSALQDISPDAASKDAVGLVIDALKSAADHDQPKLVAAQQIWAKQRERDGIADTFFDGAVGQEVDEVGPLSFLPCETAGCNIM
jgi:hypothetical protein